MLFDAVMEFGLQSAVGRTLEQTGSAVAEVDAGDYRQALASIARRVDRGDRRQDTLDGELAATADHAAGGWVRGVLEHMRGRRRRRP